MKLSNTTIIVLAVAAFAAVWFFVIKPKDGSTSILDVFKPSPDSTPNTNATATGNSQTLTGPITLGGVQYASVDAVVFPWFNQLDARNKANAFAQWPNFSNQEKAVMATIIGAYWSNSKQPPSELQTAFEAIQAKFNINTL